MARRIRSIKPEILDDEVTAALPHLEWRLFVSLWLLADDYGNLHGHAAQIKGSALWRTPDSEAKVKAALDHLAGAGLIRAYKVRGQLYFCVVGWGKHQKVDHPGKAIIPGPDQADGPSRTSGDGSRDSRETLATDQDQDRTRDQDRDQGEEAPGKPAPLKLEPTGRPPRRVKQQPPAVNPEPTERDIAHAAELGVDLAREWPAMFDYHRREAKGSADWSASWRTWCGNAVKFAAARAGPLCTGSHRPVTGLAATAEILADRAASRPYVDPFKPRGST